MNRRRITIAAAAAGAAGLAITLSACDTPSTSSVQSDQSVSNNIMKSLQQNQPVPRPNYSEMRQTLINVEEAEIAGTATTTFFYNQGNPVPIKSCPSIGYPIPVDTQLTNPDQIDYNGGSGGGGNVAIPQQDPTGVFSGTGSGTYVVCVQADGQKRVDYWEGFVETEGGAATVDSAGHIVDSGASTVTQVHK